MISSVTVCNGCCCGRVDRGNKPVPIDELKQSWKDNDLTKDVKLRISTCLGPCSKKNVSILKVGQNRIWLGSLGEDAHYEALVDWAKNISNDPSNSDLPDILKPLQFTP